MNKKYLVYSLLITFLMVCKPSFSMYGAIFKAARAVGISTMPVFGLYKAYDTNKRTEDARKESRPFLDTAIEKWGREKMKQLNVSHAESISFDYDLVWSTSGKKINVPALESIILNQALKFNNDWRSKIGFLRGDIDKIIARNAMDLKHEIGHIVNKDPQNRLYAAVTVPIGIEALSFGITKVFRKLCNIQPQPKTFLKTMLRSCSAIGAIGPKFLMSCFGLNVFSRYQETQADKFACEHAESRLELEEFARSFKEHEKPEWVSKNRDEVRLLESIRDPIHPAPVDRKEMV